MGLIKRIFFGFILVFLCLGVCSARDLEDIRKSGTLRHLGVPYANFVTGSGDGFSVELVRMFASDLGVKYRYVPADWKNVIPCLSGNRVSVRDGAVEMRGRVPVRGDLIANGLTILPWRQEVIDFSTPVFPTQVWVIARTDSSITPIEPSGDIDKDIRAVRARLKGKTVLGKKNTCLDPSLYDLEGAGAVVRLFDGKLNELAPAVMNRDAEATILDVPDSLVALEKWPGSIKVIGPVSRQQSMGVGFAKSSPELLDAFEVFLNRIKKDGTYNNLVRKYYSTAFTYYPEFFDQ